MTRSFGAGDSDIYLIKTDANGNPMKTSSPNPNRNYSNRSQRLSPKFFNHFNPMRYTGLKTISGSYHDILPFSVQMLNRVNDFISFKNSHILIDNHEIGVKILGMRNHIVRSVMRKDLNKTREVLLQNFYSEIFKDSKPYPITIVLAKGWNRNYAF